MLTEVAPGIDVQSEVLAVARFPIAVAADLKPMNGRLFRVESMGLDLADTYE